MAAGGVFLAPKNLEIEPGNPLPLGQRDLT
jgi:hypothetical protein